MPWRPHVRGNSPRRQLPPVACTLCHSCPVARVLSLLRNEGYRAWYPGGLVEPKISRAICTSTRALNSYHKFDTSNALNSYRKFNAATCVSSPLGDAFIFASAFIFHQHFHYIFHRVVVTRDSGIKFYSILLKSLACETDFQRGPNDIYLPYMCATWMRLINIICNIITHVAILIIRVYFNASRDATIHFVSPHLVANYITANQIPVLRKAYNSGWSSELSAELHLDHFHLLQLRCVLARVSDLTSYFTATLSTCSLPDIRSRNILALNSRGWINYE